MRRITRWGIAGALGALLLMPNAAHAAFPSGQYWGGSLFQTGFDVTMSLDGNTLTLDITNIGDFSGDYAGVFAAIGLVNVPAGATITGLEAPAGWAFNTSNSLGGDGLPATIWAYYAGAPAPQNGLDLGESATFKFTLSGDYTWDNIGVAVHSISGPGSCSTKFGVWNGGADSNDFGPDGYDPACTTVTVPEPGTNALLAIGVLGLGFVATRRRSLGELLGQA